MPNVVSLYGRSTPATRIFWVEGTVNSLLGAIVVLRNDVVVPLLGGISAQLVMNNTQIQVTVPLNTLNGMYTVRVPLGLLTYAYVKFKVEGSRRSTPITTVGDDG